MTREEKELLLVDLSARFPYNVAIDCRSENSRFTCYLTSDILREIQNNNCYWECKTYLFPLSSMTEEQKNQLKEIWSTDMDRAIDYSISGEEELCDLCQLSATKNVIDWLNANHFDYRDLIKKGLAIDATRLNIY